MSRTPAVTIHAYGGTNNSLELPLESYSNTDEGAVVGGMGAARGRATGGCEEDTLSCPDGL